MWIISPRCGLLSIVLADDPSTGQPAVDRLMIRARSKRHLELLREQHPVLAKARILTSPIGLDYRYRLVVDRDTLAQVFQEMAQEVSWRNVKAAAGGNSKALGEAYVRAFHEVHAAFVRAERASGGDGDDRKTK